MWQYQEYSELYHWGVKGMRWGHRKGKSDSDSTSNKKVNKKDMTPEEKKAHTKKCVKRGAAVVAGLGIAGVTVASLVKYGRMANRFGLAANDMRDIREMLEDLTI